MSSQLKCVYHCKFSSRLSCMPRAALPRVAAEGLTAAEPSKRFPSHLRYIATATALAGRASAPVDGVAVARAFDTD